MGMFMCVIGRRTMKDHVNLQVILNHSRPPEEFENASDGEQMPC